MHLINYLQIKNPPHTNVTSAYNARAAARPIFKKEFLLAPNPAKYNTATRLDNNTLVIKGSFTIIDIYESVHRVRFLMTPSPLPQSVL